MFKSSIPLVRRRAFNFFKPWLSAVGLWAAVFQVQAHEAEIIVSRTATGQLQAAIEFPQPVELERSVFPGITGHATGLLGIHATILDEPTNNAYQLSDAADLRFILLTKTPGMEVWNDTGSAFMTNGQSFYVGVPVFDTHPIWNLVNDASDHTNTLTLKFHDVNGVYTDSPPIVLSFTPLVPPILQLQSENSGQITLTWPTHADDWFLESAAAITATHWLAVTNVPAISGDNFFVTLDAGRAQNFFRLHKL
jgi:hypothetical protein